MHMKLVPGRFHTSPDSFCRHAEAALQPGSARRCGRGRGRALHVRPQCLEQVGGVALDHALLAARLLAARGQALEDRGRGARGDGAATRLALRVVAQAEDRVQLP